MILVKVVLGGLLVAVLFVYLLCILFAANRLKIGNWLRCRIRLLVVGHGHALSSHLLQVYEREHIRLLLADLILYFASGDLE